MRNLSGEVALITGAGSGIGAATARRLANLGASVALVGRHPGPLNRQMSAIRAAGGQALAVSADVSDFTQLQAAFAAVLSAFGPVSILINNAAVIGPVRQLAHLSPEAWAQNLETNLTGPFLAARLALPNMLARGRGVIVNVGSEAGRDPVVGWGAYSAAKAGLWMLTRALAQEVGLNGVRVYEVQPGVVDTPMQAAIRAADPAEFTEANLAQFRALKTKGRLISPNEPARLIAWLCTFEAADLHGQEVDVNDPEIRSRCGLEARTLPLDARENSSPAAEKQQDHLSLRPWVGRMAGALSHILLAAHRG